MNWDILKGKWDQMRGSIQREWGDLTDSELDEIRGERTRLIGKLQEKYGWTKLDAETRVDTWAKNNLN